jgi:NitT/TauT family transport system substrate-binding protein
MRRKMSIVHLLEKTFFLAMIFLISALQAHASELDHSGQLKLKVVILPVLSFAPFFVAAEEGYFTEQGLQIEFVRLNKAAQAIPALAQGQLDVVGGGVSFGILNAMLRGAKIKFVGDKGYFAPTNCAFLTLMARQDLIKSRELENFIQIKGRRMVLDPSNFEGYFIEKLISKVGLTLADIETVDIPDALLPEAMKKGTIDLAVTAEPWLTRILQTESAINWVQSQQVIPGFQFGFLVYGPSLLEKNPNGGKRFMVAYLKAVQQFNQGKTERNLKIIAKHTELDQDFLKKACWPSFRSNGQINISSVLDFQSWGFKKGLLDKTISPDQFWDPGFIEYANKVLNKSNQ